MENNPAATIATNFSGLKDPRVERTREHKLLAILVIAICAIIGGCDAWAAIADYGRDQQEWLAKFLELPSGIPSHDTFWRVFRVLDAEQFQACFVAWIRTVSHITAGEVVAIDGKFVRRSHDKGAAKGPSTWSAPGRRATIWYWANARSMKSRMKSPLSLPDYAP
ncbi:MAG: ISAs1 family transposase [Caldilineaceae bacterium]